MTDSAIVVEQVAFNYGDMAMLFDVAIETAAVTAVMGPSGAGKTTLINLVAGFERPSSGNILIEGANVTNLPPAARPVSMIFQENNLFAHLSVWKNVGLGRSSSLKLGDDDRTAVEDALARTGLAGKGNRLPKELSGGERQRVAIARALVRNRPVLLLDEPFAALGPSLRADMLDLVETLQAERAMTIVLVTHQPEDARRIARNLVFIDNGRVAAAGAVADFLDGHGPAAFRHYMGQDGNLAANQHPARKPT